MKRYLVGHTGFVGGNIAAVAPFEGLFNSKNIGEAFGGRPDLLVFAGVRAEKFLANREPERDRADIETAFANIQSIAPRRLVLISTVDVYPHPLDVDEDAEIDERQHTGAYGQNRLLLERLVRQSGIQSTVIRLPGLYGEGLKKNLIYDVLQVIPAILSGAKYRELAVGSALIARHYAAQDNGFYRCTAQGADRAALRGGFRRVGFTAAQFTDSRDRFQFYNLRSLWEHIEKALAAGLPLLNLATEPVTAAEVVLALTGEAFCNEFRETPVNYDFKTKHAALLGGRDGYILDRAGVLRDIRETTAGWQID